MSSDNLRRWICSEGMIEKKTSGQSFWSSAAIRHQGVVVISTVSHRFAEEQILHSPFILVALVDLADRDT